MVRRGEDGVFQAFEQHFHDDPDVEAVIWDRRARDRRSAPRPVPIERRRGERRGTPPTSWSIFGFLFAPASGKLRAP